MLPRTESEIDEFLQAFENGTLPKPEWTHAAHLLTGASYVYALGESAATDKMRMCVRRYNEAVGGKNTETSGYHETITVAWIKVLAKLLSECQPIERAEFAALAVRQFGNDRAYLQRFYEFDLVNSKEARRTWVPPTIGTLD